MSLAAGTRLGPYEVLAPLGAGAMGEVYRARDPRLGREVAIKVLPPQFAADAERLSRFEREARAAGALQHANILTLFDIGTHGGAPYVVSELLSGQTLRQVLQAGPLPLRRALEFAGQIARGLAAAHEQGIVHRDLKPENLFVTQDRIVKILDFGLARVAQQTAASQDDSVAGTLTESGMLLGTAGYMAPEQARGERVDHRADLFALGTVLYEMVTGRRAFQGDSAVATLFAILNDEPPPASSLRAETPATLDRLIQHCLEKRPQDRFRSAHDLAFQLEALMPTEESRLGMAPALSGASRVPRRWRERLGWGLAIGGLLAGAMSLVALRTRAPESGPVILSLNPPDGVTLAEFSSLIAFSPDGSSLAFSARDTAGQGSLWLRRLDSETATRIHDLGTTWGPFWSPDGRVIGAFSGRILRRVPVPDGRPTSVGEAPNARGGTWNADGVIVYAPTPEGPLFAIPASGGDATPVTTLDSSRRETSHRFPCFLPDGDHFLYATLPPGPRGFEIRVGSLKQKTSKRIMTARSAPIYAEPGYLIFEQDRHVMAQRFDARRLELKGEAVIVADAPPTSELDAEPVATASGQGRMAVLRSVPPHTQIEVLDRSGRVLRQVPIPPGAWRMGRCSPSGRELAVFWSRQLWVVDIERGVPMKVADLSTTIPTVVWSPDGARLAYVTQDGPREEIQIRSLGGEARRLSTTDAAFKFVWDWAPGGHLLINSMADDWDIWLAAVDGSVAPRPMSSDPGMDADARISPDGRWLAFSNNESGRAEVYVQSFPHRERRMRVSSAGGAQPMWAREGRELLFLQGQKVMSVAVPAGHGFRPGTPRELFTLPPLTSGIDILPGGEGFLISRDLGEPRREFQVILNWTALAKARL